MVSFKYRRVSHLGKAPFITLAEREAASLRLIRSPSRHPLPFGATLANASFVQAGLQPSPAFKPSSGSHPSYHSCHTQKRLSV